jgi:hypothetical protein
MRTTPLECQNPNRRRLPAVLEHTRPRVREKSFEENRRRLPAVLEHTRPRVREKSFEEFPQRPAPRAGPASRRPVGADQRRPVTASMGRTRATHWRRSLKVARHRDFRSIHRCRPLPIRWAAFPAYPTPAMSGCRLFSNLFSQQRADRIPHQLSSSRLSRHLVADCQRERENHVIRADTAEKGYPHRQAIDFCNRNAHLWGARHSGDACQRDD